MSDILRPFHHAGKVTSGLDILADTEVSGPLLEKRVLDFLRTSLRLREGGGGSFFSRLKVIEKISQISENSISQDFEKISSTVSLRNEAIDETQPKSRAVNNSNELLLSIFLL